MNASLPLERFRVLDLTRMRAGPTAVRQFADWGAQVLMVEPKDGAGEVSGGRLGSDFQNLNRNKKSIALDLKHPEGHRLFLRLVERADVVFENFRPDVKTRLGIDYEALRVVNPRLVYVSISGFGQDGPYSKRPGLDQVIQGMSGLMSITGAPGQGPMRAGVAITDTSAGLYAAIGAMTALLEREVTGEGRWVRTSLLQAAIAILDFQAARWLMDGDIPIQAGNDHPTAAPMGLFAASDGHINIAVVGDLKFRKFCEIAGLAHLPDREEFSGDARARNRAALNREVGAAIAKQPARRWIEVLNSVGIPCGPVYRMDEVFEDPQVKQLGMVKRAPHPVLGDINLVGQPIEMFDVDASLRAAAPDVGQNTKEVLADLGLGEDEIARLIESGIVN